MYKCDKCGKVSEVAGDCCGQPMREETAAPAAEPATAPVEPTPTAPAEPVPTPEAPTAEPTVQQ